MVQSNGNLESNFQIPKIKFTKLFINGEFVDSVSGNTFETIDPRNVEVIARIAEGDKADVNLAVKAAREAFDNGPWPRLPPSERRNIMLKFADLIIENAEEIAALDAMDAGKLFAPGKNIDIPAAASTIRYYAGAADKIHGATLKMGRDMQGYTLLEPIGVVGHIIPWNFPTQMFVVKVGPALAAGCTMIVKPAEQTPLSALYYAQLAKQAGVPDGVINVVTGFGSTAGAALCSHMDVDKISFTGSTEVGRLVMQAAALSNLKPVSLELGSAPAHNSAFTVAVGRSVGRTPLHNNVNLTTKPLSFNCNLSSPLHLIPTFSANSASHGSFAISSSTGTETPVVSEDTINVLDDVQVFDLKGQGVPISDLWKDRKAVVAFARHFGCVLCRIRADYLAAEKDKMDAAGVALVLIGPGSVDQARTFYEQTKFKGEVYADPSYRSYEALRFVSGITTTFTPGAGLKIIQAYMDGYRQDWELSFEKDTRTRGGWRQGGIIVAGPGKNNITYIHKDKEAGDDPDIKDILNACCVQPS